MIDLGDLERRAKDIPAYVELEFGDTIGQRVAPLIGVRPKDLLTLISALRDAVGALEKCEKLMSGAPSCAPLTDDVVLDSSRMALDRIRKAVKL